jgi:hypothetical protein
MIKRKQLLFYYQENHLHKKETDIIMTIKHCTAGFLTTLPH